MARSKLDIIIDSKFRATGVNEAEAATKRLGGATQKASIDFDKLAASAVAAGLILKKTYDQLKQGAALDQTRNKFDKLTNSIGASSDILRKLQVTTRGTVDEFTLMQNASLLINTGLAKNEGALLRMSRVASGLNLDLQVLGLTMANDSKLRLDNLGLSVERVNELMKQLQSEGFDGDAFDEAVLVGLEEKMGLLENAVLTNSRKFQVLESNMKDFRDTALETVGASDLLAVSLDSWIGIIGGANGVIGATTGFLDRLDERLSALNINYGEFLVIVGGAALGIEDFQEEIEDFRVTLDGLGEATSADSVMLQAMAGSFDDVAQSARIAKTEVSGVGLIGGGGGQTSGINPGEQQRTRDGGRGAWEVGEIGRLQATVDKEREARMRALLGVRDKESQANEWQLRQEEERLRLIDEETRALERQQKAILDVNAGYSNLALSIIPELNDEFDTLQEKFLTEAAAQGLLSTEQLVEGLRGIGSSEEDIGEAVRQIVEEQATEGLIAALAGGGDFTSLFAQAGGLEDAFSGFGQDFEQMGQPGRFQTIETSAVDQFMGLLNGGGGGLGGTNITVNITGNMSPDAAQNAAFMGVAEALQQQGITANIRNRTR